MAIETQQPIRRISAREKRLIEDKIRDFGEMAGRIGCPIQQQANFIKAGIWLQPKQLEMSAAARSCDYICPECSEKHKQGIPVPIDCEQCGPTAVGVGGARGGGKSQWMWSQVCLDDCQRYPGLKFLFIRKTLASAREQIRDLLKKICQNVEYNYREQAGTVEFPNGSFVIIKHFKDEKDIDGFLGNEYDGIAAEELTTFSFDKWKNLMTCLRSSKTGWRPRFYGAWNWGGVGHAWVKRVFYDPWKEGKQRQTRYILAKVDDNSHNNPEYINTLRTLTGWKYQSWYMGNPDFQSGQFFTNWNEDVHVYPNAKFSLDERRIVSWSGGYDHGFGHPSCFILSGKDREGIKYSVEEWHRAETVIEEQSEFIRDCCRKHNISPEDLDYIAAGKDCFHRNEDGRTIAQEFEMHGITLTPVQIDRVNAWAVMQQQLGDVEREIPPHWFIHRNCVNLISQIPLAQCHELRKGDIAKMNADPETKEGGDDALEAARNDLVLEPSGVLRWAMPVNIGGYRPLTITLG